MATTLITVPRGGGDPIEEFPANILSITDRLNQPGSILFTIPTVDPKTIKANLDPLVHEVHVRRNGTTVWAGPLLALDENTDTITFAGEGLLAYTRGMAIVDETLTYTATDQTAIVWDLIDRHQAKASGDVGLVDGTTATGVLRDRTYLWWEATTVYDAITRLCDVIGGFDLSVNPTTRAVTTHYPKAGRRTDLVFDDHNILRFRRQIMASEQASKVVAIGAGEGETAIRTSSQSSAATSTYGLRHRVISFSDVSNETTLQAHAAKELSRLSMPPNLLSVDVRTDNPPLYSYHIGDEVRVKWPSGWSPVSEFQRLVGRDVSWQSGLEVATLHLEALQ